MPKSKKPSKLLLRSKLNESLFDPRETGATAALVEMDNPQYLCLKVQEEITKINRTWEEQPAVNKSEHLKTVVSLLVLARVQLEA